MDIPQGLTDVAEDPQLALYVRFNPSIPISTLTSISLRLPTLVFPINQVPLFNTILTHLSSIGIHTAT